MSSNGERGSLARVAGFDAVLVGSGINTLTAAALLARDGWSVCVLERSDRLGGAIRTEADYTLPGFTHEVISSWHPLFTGSPAYAELGDELASPRARVPQHGASDGDGVSRRRGDVPPDVARGQRDGVRALRRRGRRRVAAAVRGLHGERRPQLRRARHRALVGCGPLARPEDAAPLRSSRAARVRGACALDVPRLDDGDLRLGARARPPRTMGAPHGARARAGGLGLHDAGDRLRRSARRDAGPGRRRRPARRRPRRDRARRGR